MKKLICIISFVLILCTGTVALADISPVIIQNGSLDGIKQLIISDLLPMGWTIEKDTANSLQFTKTLTSFSATLFFGTAFSSNPEGRLTFNFFKKANGVGVVPLMEIVTNPGSGFEKTSLTNPEKDMTQLNLYLTRIKTIFDGGIGTGALVKREDDNTTVINTVFTGSSAEKEGLHVGDKVLLVNVTEAPRITIAKIHSNHLWAEQSHSLTLTVKPPHGKVKRVKLTNEYIPPQYKLIAQYCPEKAKQEEDTEDKDYFTGNVGKVEGFESTLLVEIPDRNLFELKCSDESVRFSHGQEKTIDNILSKALYEFVFAGEKQKNIVKMHIGTLGNNFKVYLWSQDDGQNRWIEVRINDQSIRLGRDETLKLSKVLEQTSRKLEEHS